MTPQPTYKELRPLFKITTSQKIQTWRIQQDGGRFRSVQGLMNGAETFSGWTTCKPTRQHPDVEDQAWAEIQSRYKKQLEQGGYSDELETAGRHTYFVPMLAKVYVDRKTILADQWNRLGTVWSQPKLDGARMVLTASGAWSRKGKKILTAGHIVEALGAIFRQFPDLVLDGELYNHDLKDDFPKLMSLARKAKDVTAAEIYEATKILQFHVFDCAGSHGHLPFKERYDFLVNLLFPYLLIAEPVRLVASERVRDYDHLDAAYMALLEQGYEGQIIRYSAKADDRGYDMGPNRSPNLLKRKEFHDREFLIVRVEEGNGTYAGVAGGIAYLTKDGKPFSSGLRGDLAFRQDLLERAAEYVGGVGTVRFQGLSPKGIPRFPVTVALWEEGRTH